MSGNKIDFTGLSTRFDKLSNGQKAELRRVASPRKIAMVPAFYRLLPGVKTDIRWQRTAFFVPFVKHVNDADPLGVQLARSKKISELRLFQVVRSQSPNDLIQLRRLVRQIEPALDWQNFGETLFFWNDNQKRRLLEQYFINVA